MTSLEVYRENWAAIEENIDVNDRLQKSAEAFRRKFAMIEGWPHGAVMMNANQFLAILNYDLSVALYEVESREDGWARGLQARLAALLIVEFMRSVPAVLGREFREAVAPWMSEEDAATIADLRKRLAALRKTHEGALDQTRNVALGHRGQDATKQLEVIRGIEISVLLELLWELVRWLTDARRLFTGFINKVTEQMDLATAKLRSITPPLLE